MLCVGWACYWPRQEQSDGYCCNFTQDMLDQMAPQLRTESASIVSTTVAWSARMLPRNSLQVAAITRWKQLWASSSMMECQTVGTGNPSLKRTTTTTGLLRVSQKTITLLLSTTQAKISRNVLEWNLQFDQLKNKSFSHNFSLTIQQETGDYYKWKRYWQTNLLFIQASCHQCGVHWDK